jgi:hypothetical protein
MRNRTTIARPSLGARTLAHAVLAACFICIGLPQSASAEVRVSGTAKAVNVTAQDATLDEILRALQANFKFQYKGGALPNPISGTYSGSLRSVVVRLLTGHNYVTREANSELIVTLVGASGVAAAKGNVAANSSKNSNPDAEPDPPSNVPPRRFLHGGGAAPPNSGAADGKDCKGMINGQEVAVEC